LEGRVLKKNLLWSEIRARLLRSAEFRSSWTRTL